MKENEGVLNENVEWRMLNKRLKNITIETEKRKNNVRKSKQNRMNGNVEWSRLEKVE